MKRAPPRPAYFGPCGYGRPNPPNPVPCSCSDPTDSNVCTRQADDGFWQDGTIYGHYRIEQWQCLSGAEPPCNSCVQGGENTYVKFVPGSNSAVELCNNEDDNCDGQVNEGNPCYEPPPPWGPPACPNAFLKPPLQALCPFGSQPDTRNPAYCCPNCPGEPEFCDTGYAWSWQTCQCEPGSPILIDITGNGFALTSNQNGVDFDINGDGVKEHIAWTKSTSDDAWLALDIDGNGTIDNGRELFGNFTAQPRPASEIAANGFLALAEYDKSANGGNLDGMITRADAVFDPLRLWRDTNHNGMSEPSELFTLAAMGLERLYLNYKESTKTDTHGNQFKYRAKVTDGKNAQLVRWAWDVFLVSQ